MPSPFPGMDPYLEAADIWPDFHHSLAVQLSTELNGNLPPGYYADLGRREEVGMIEEPGESQRIVPDIVVVRRPPLPRQRAEGSGDTAVSPPSRRDASPSIRITGD